MPKLTFLRFSLTHSGLLCVASNVSVAVNSSIEFNCSVECTPDITWSYRSPTSVSSRLEKLSSLTCFKDKRCHVTNGTDTGHSLLTIHRVQFIDDGTYLCSAGIKNQPSYCGVRFQLAVYDIRTLKFTDSVV